MRTQALLQPLPLLALALSALTGGCSAREASSYVFDSGAVIRADGGPGTTDAGRGVDAFVPPGDAEASKDSGADRDAKPDADTLVDGGRRGVDAEMGPCDIVDDLGSELGGALFTGTTVGGPTDTPSCGSAGPVQRFGWQAPEAGTFTFSLEGSSYDTLLEVRRTCAPGTSLACNDDAIGTRSRVNVTLGAEDRVVIVVAGYSGATGDFSLSIGDGVASSETALLCHNGEDDDLDGQIDCADYDCRAEPDCTETACDDGADNDGDGATDCADYDCDSEPVCTETVCDDGVDNDGDGVTDCRDYDCYYADACTETTCDDGVDNDGDGLTDCRDYDCYYSEACTETDCSDGLDDDFDGSIDCRDYDCVDDAACTENDCDDGVDNDSDGSLDCADSDCRFACRDCSVDDELGSAVGMGVYSGTTVGATNGSVPGCSSYSTAPEKVLHWRAPAAGDYTFSLAGSSYDTVLYAMNSCDAGVELACNDDARSTLRSLITLTVTSGEELLLFVDGYSTRSGDFTLSIVRDAPTSEAGLCADSEDNDFDEESDCDDYDCDSECL